jgi:NAD(P)-dependent dehydrogenase (short-subunit alcohol dehydrogenase family)
MKTPPDMFSLVGRNALVSGASRGIGAALANALSSAGAAVTGFASSPKPSEELDSAVRYERIDLSDPSAGLRVAAVLEEAVRMDILVNAAGVSLGADSGASEASRFRKTIEINLIAAYNVTMSSVPFMSRGESVINVSSINSKLGFAENPGYVASKGGLSALTRALALDLGSRGIRVNALVPGYFPTAMTIGSYDNPVAREQRSERTMLGRWGNISELSGPIVFLASDASSYMTGQELIVDGGWTAKGL